MNTQPATHAADTPLSAASNNVAQTTARARLDQWIMESGTRLGALAAVASVRRGEHAEVLAHWPAPGDSAVAKANIAAIVNGPSVQRLTGDEPTAVVCLPIRLAGRPGAIGFRLPAHDSPTDDELYARVRAAVLRRVDDTAATTPDTQTPSTPHSDRPALVEQQGAALEVIASLLDHDTPQRASRALVDSLAARFGCSRVTLGTLHLHKITLQAVSGSADFDRRSSSMVSIARALRETTDLGRTIALPASDAAAALPPEHRALFDHLKSPAVLSVPLVADGKTAGAVMFERDRAFDAAQIEQIEQLIALGAPVLALRQRDASGPLAQGARAAQRQLARVFGPQRLILKCALLALAALVIWSTQYTRVLTVSADAAIEARVQRAVVAGADSFISEVEKRAGDVVYQGDVLARLDVENLRLERLKWESERDKLAKEQRATLAQRDRARIRVLTAQRAQAQAQIDFLDAQIARAVLRAPIDGVVVAGDLSEALGSPVERGQLLFEVASLRDYRLVLDVDESDIGDIGEGYRGNLKLRSLPHATFEFVVTRITPVSNASDGRNAFRLEANLENPPESLRPGMQGVGKISAGEHSLAVIWTRSFVRWARLQMWRLGLTQ